MKYGQINNFINGKFKSASGAVKDIDCPYDGSIIGQTRLSTKDDVKEAVDIASVAQKDWAKITTKARVEVHYNYRELLKKHKEEIAEMCHLENGKSMREAFAGMDKAIEITGYAASIPQMISGQVQEVSSGVECKSVRVPIGVIASITPFNFPIMIPHWTIPIALATGNATVLKPSSITPISAWRCMELWKEAGLPDGLLNMIIGESEAGTELCENTGVQGVTFVGSTPVADKVSTIASAHKKRVMAFGGAKNYLLLTKYAHQKAASEVVSSFTGMAGQRCMAACVLMEVGDNPEMIRSVVEEAETLRPGKTMPPLISKVAVEKFSQYLADAEQAGAKILLDGRKTPHEGKESGYYFGASIIDWRGLEDKLPEEEVFGPILEIIHADTLDEALDLQNKSPYGNGASIFTQNGREAQEATKRLQAGMLGVNIGIPVPREPFGFGGVKNSRYASYDITGTSCMDFCTSEIKITTKWNPADRKDWMS